MTGSKLRDITIGKYYNNDSVIHRLDPRVKLAGLFIYLILLFACKNYFAYILLIAFLFAVIRVSGVPIMYVLRGLKTIIYILLFTTFFNILFTPGDALFKWRIINITEEGIVRAVFYVIRFILLIMASSMLTLTTTPNSLTDGLEKSFSFLNKIGFPVHEMALMMSIALRFIPVLTEEANRIITAQTVRGMDFEKGGVIEKAKKMLPIFIPLFVSSFRRANELATAMEARCYHGGEGRTRLNPLEYDKMDYSAYFVMLILVIICAGMTVTGIGRIVI